MFKICIFHEITGLYCPGCGGTRAFFALLHGHPILSFMYNPAVLYFAFVAIFYAVWGILYLLYANGLKHCYFSNITKNKQSGKFSTFDNKILINRPKFTIIFVFIFLGLILGNMFIKDAFLIFFHIDLMP